MAKALGIDLGTRFAKAVLVEKTAKGLTVTGFAQQGVPAEGEAPERGSSWIRDLVTQVGWKGEQAAVAVQARETTLRELSVPFTDPEQLARVVRFEAENYLPFPLEEAVLDFLPLETSAEGTRALVFAVCKTTLRELQAVLETAGVDPYVVGVEPTALLEALRGTGSLPEEPALLLDLGAASTTVIYLEDARPTYMRVLRVGADLTSAAPSDVSRYVEKISRELRRLLAALPESAGASRVLVLGGNATEAVVESLGASLEREVEPLRLAPAATLKGEVPAGLERNGLVALGLALSLLGAPTFPINLRRGEFRYRPKLEKWRRPLSFILAGWTALAVVCGIGFGVRLGGLSRLDRRLTAHEQAIWESLSPGEPRPSDLYPWMHGELMRLRALASSGPSGKRTSALQTLRAILDAIPPGITVTVRSVNITPGRARIDMVTDSHTAATAIGTAVTEKTNFVASPKNLKYEGGKSRFELEAVPAEGGPL